VSLASGRGPQWWDGYGQTGGRYGKQENERAQIHDRRWYQPVPVASTRPHGDGPNLSGMTGSVARRLRVPVVCAVVAGLLASGFAAETAQAITKSEVEQVCADSREAYDTYQAARSDFLDASGDLEAANWAVAEAEAKEQRIRGQYESNQNRRAELEPQVESQAIDLYMQSVGSSTAGFAALDNPEDALMVFEFMSAATDDRMEALNDLGAITAELDRLGGDLDAVVAEKTDHVTNSRPSPSSRKRRPGTRRYGKHGASTMDPDAPGAQLS